MRAIVTFSFGPAFERKNRHDRFKKQHGICPLGSVDCTDITGAHHSLLFDEDHYDKIRMRAEELAKSKGLHVTRIELIDIPEITLE